ncbi:hypothetical protein EDC94DRAFT_618009 [Helicostylum pulchrum]|uniref:18S rRNA factor 2 n=1 Tax=Helicostylum pulchrum TaxID=562976 RepID=A0ABP9XRR7_9FUNG|nr:hypothetical protein EDC94DRAFT_618009 [Helicostylum pulchrum]
MSNKKQDLFGLNNDSEEEDISLDEEEQEDSRFSKTRLQKQSLSDSDASDDSDDNENSDDNEDNDANEDSENEEEKPTISKDDQESETKAEDGLEGEGYDAPQDLSSFGVDKKRVRTKKVKSLTPEELEKFEKARKKTGVCYLSSIPLFMKPSRVRNLLEKHAEIGRIYLVPEDAKVTARRKKYTKNRRTNFVEGWVEFKDKKIAKALAEHLNMKNIGGKRQSKYYHDMWNIKYLPKFKWHHLTEHMAHENQARQQRLRNEIEQSKRENKTYIQNVERAKMLKNMEQKKRKREGEPAEPAKQRISRTFEQRGKVDREVDPSKSGKQALEKLDNNLKGVLGSIFSKK